MSEKLYHYKCLGCNKSYNSNNFYKYGWICPNCRKDGIKLKIKCSVCNKDIYVAFSTYMVKDPNIPWRCRACNDDYRKALFESKSPEEKAAFIKQQRERSKNWWANLSPEEKQAHHDRKVDMWVKLKENGKAEAILTALKEGRANWWNSLSEEQKLISLQVLYDGRDDYIASLSNDELRELTASAREARQDLWDNMTFDTFNKWQLDLNFKYIENVKKCQTNSGLVEANGPELQFIDKLKFIGIEWYFQYPSTIIHPDFKKYFGFNPILNTDLVCATHYWDFRIEVGPYIFYIDIDGSLHFKDANDNNIVTDKTGRQYHLLDATNFKDSQRPYQTDGLPAYIIQCPNNKLDNESLVIYPNGKKYGTFEKLINFFNKIITSHKNKIF